MARKCMCWFRRGRCFDFIRFKISYSWKCHVYDQKFRILTKYKKMISFFQKLFKCQVNLRGDFVMIPDSLLLDGICSCFFCEGKYVYFLTWVLNSWAFCNIQRHWRCWDTSYVLTRPMILKNCRTSWGMRQYQTHAFLIYLCRCHFVKKFAKLKCL